MIEILKNIYSIFPQKKKRFRVLRFFRKEITFEDTLRIYVDKGIYFVSIVSPMMSIPQIWGIYTTGNIVGLSLATWLSYFLLTFFWLAYGLIHKDKPIIITQVLWVFVYGIVTAQILFYSFL